jgi:hypothetical protein
VRCVSPHRGMRGERPAGSRQGAGYAVVPPAPGTGNAPVARRVISP